MIFKDLRRISGFKFLLLSMMVIFFISPVFAVRIVANPQDLTMSVGDVQFVVLHGLPNDGFPEYTSSDNNVAVVSSDQYNSASFRIEAIGEGTAIITFVLEDWSTGSKVKHTTECIVTVTGKEAVAIETITLEPSFFHLEIGEERQLNVKVVPFEANVGDVIIKSYDDKIIQINESAIVSGAATGYTEIIAETRDGKISAKSKVFSGEKTEVVGVVLENIWLKAKEFLAGESFKVRKLDGACGVRG